MIQQSRFWVYIQKIPWNQHLKEILNHVFLEQWFLGFSMFQNYLEGLLNYQLLGSSQLWSFWFNRSRVSSGLCISFFKNIIL